MFAMKETKPQTNLHQNTRKLTLARKCTGKDCPLEKETSLLQRRPNLLAPSVNEAPPIVHDVLRSSGQPLDDSTRAFMEPRFNQDFSHVRVHTDAKAAESAHAVNALAYTVGHNIVMRREEYAPTTDAGKRLLAHELAHVVQQEGSQRLQKLQVGAVGNIYEQEADRVANQVIDTSQSIEKRGQQSFTCPVKTVFLGNQIQRQDDNELQAYLTKLRKTQTIEDYTDSDNKARAVVHRGLFKNESLTIKILLIREMLSGFTGNNDEQAILAILVILESVLPTEREQIATTIGVETLYDNFQGKELDKLYALYPVLNSLHPRGSRESNTYSIEDYIERWEKEHGRQMTSAERETLARGCIGITALNLGSNGLPNPELSQCYTTFKEAWEKANTMNAYLKTNYPNLKALIFSKRFWSAGKDYLPDPQTGKVDMSQYDYKARPGFTNFDYGLYDEKTGKWWHANHKEPGMKIYESNLKHYSRSLLDFDKQVFCIGISNL